MPQSGPDRPRLSWELLVTSLWSNWLNHRHPIYRKPDSEHNDPDSVPSWQPIGTTAIVLLLLLAHLLYVYVVVLAWRTAKECRSYDFQNQESTQTTRY